MRLGGKRYVVERETLDTSARCSRKICSEDRSFMVRWMADVAFGCMMRNAVKAVVDTQARCRGFDDVTVVVKMREMTSDCSGDVIETTCRIVRDESRRLVIKSGGR